MEHPPQLLAHFFLGLQRGFQLLVCDYTVLDEQVTNTDFLFGNGHGYCPSKANRS